ncbi:MAG: dihydrolipoyl dehydrogenase [Deltaproteobacteria bacterium]|jgi:dihydrolipoamide dehydrogenase|nr:dihydrolipoyl dehydrogenase [Deltaproteobacteria bacterium]
MSSIPEKTELAVIGAGPGGYTAAFRAAELGLNVTLIDPEPAPGGVCLYRGCIPSKSLLHLAKLINETAEANSLGLTFASPKIDRIRIQDWKTEVIAKLTKGLATKAEKLDIKRIRGTATFENPRMLAVKTHDGQQGQLEFKQAILATGSRPATLSAAPPDCRKVIDSSGALELNDIPKSLLVIGGGYIGLEMGSVYAAFGSKVTVVEMTAELLPGCDRDVVSVLKRRLDKQFESILVKTKVTKLKEQKNGVMATLEDKNGETSNSLFDTVLVAIGRSPNTDRLNLDQTNIQVNEQGFVVVDAQMRTTEQHIFAIGDIAGEPMLAHKAYAEAMVAAEAAAGMKTLFDPRAIPAVVFTDPEIAWCGLTETEAKDKQLKFKSAKMPWRGNGRTLTLGRDDGMTKLLVDPESDRLLGIAVVGPGAGELISEGALALEMAATAEDLRWTIHPHPTLAETLYDTAHQVSPGSRKEDNPA